MSTIATARDHAKTALFEALKNNDGDTTNEIVIAAIEKLASLNPYPASVENRSLLEGNWLLINAPNFPGRQQDEQGRYIYTLGRLAFNMFEPTETLVEIERVMQPVFATGKGDELTHDIVVEFKTINRHLPELTGIIKNLAICSPKSQDSVEVQLTGGELMPKAITEPSQMDDWLRIFGQDVPSTPPNLKTRIASIFMKWMFGITPASTINEQTGKKTFAMTRSPKGILKVLYLDDELRITRGNREAVLICQRQP